jgi:hypothetical protein
MKPFTTPWSKNHQNPKKLPSLHSLALRGCPPPPAGNPAVYPAGAPRAGKRKFKITLAGMNAKVKYNEELIQKAGNIKYWCTGRKNEVGPAVDPAGTPRVPPGGLLDLSPGGGVVDIDECLDKPLKHPKPSNTAFYCHHYCILKLKFTSPYCWPPEVNHCSTLALLCLSKTKPEGRH